jgi:hypothetical protein
MQSVAANGILDRAFEWTPAPYHPLIGTVYPQAAAQFSDYSFDLPETTGIDYFQAGLRFTTTVGSVDFGIQYFYGNLFRPSVSIDGVDEFLNDLMVNNIILPPYYGNELLLNPRIEYSRYHQIGLDYAQVLAGFNVRAEAAVHLTEDISGDDGAVQNPFIAWSLGFDRDIFGGININIQCNESLRLFDDKVLKNPAMDSEANADITSTRLILQITKQFFRDKLECKITGIWGIEDNDYHIVPSLAWTINDIRAEIAGGIFAGDSKGELGQYWKNNFVKLGLRYSF